MMAFGKVIPQSKLQTVRLNQHTEGVDLVIGFNDGHFNLVTLSNNLDRHDVANIFRSLSIDVSQFEIH